ncbi:hypothetical protein CC85DRAFT_283331 [Cutaneotrichosporon oleaginosum]|uniref:DUF1665 domain-containing protein n=1 Tax=Cutaneotrichosporon oleaginosum TaxID=879819 RepID=A0A0J0XUB9_9TREE|nr:uncharacterized protein CC85DRAFT_283331 [Cutaneotrichosporon oleaginosum]KLT44696.1 hypothetical protein CC85DRAFT_283331 [Cutaneotrichosporon oleaginosum]TXT07682.1 hypothetical protein COLE_04606 [Cutaneotrichosporon oleaginosum]
MTTDPAAAAATPTSTSDTPKLLLPGIDLPLDTYAKLDVLETTKEDGKTRVKVRRFPSAVLEDEWKSNTPTMRERAMMRVIDLLTDKPNWEEKVADETIVAKWRAEALALPLKQGFSDAMFDFVVAELRDKAALFKKNGGVVSVYDGAAAVFKTDTALTPELVQRLGAAIKPLEDVPEDEKDWHPGSDEQVLDLVHPSLFPLVYGKTRIVRREIALADALASWGSGETIAKTEGVKKKQNSWYYTLDPERLLSRNYQWLPADVALVDGKAKFTSYINNLHPEEHAELYGVLEELVERAVPLWFAAYDRVMTWMGAEDGVGWEDRENTVNRIWCMDSNRQCTTPEVCKGYCDAWNNPDNPDNQGTDESDNEGEGDGEDGAEDEEEDDADGSDNGAEIGSGSDGLEDLNMPAGMSTDSDDDDDHDDVDSEDSDMAEILGVTETDDTDADATTHDKEDEKEEEDRAPPADGDIPLPSGYDSEDEANQVWFEATHKVLQPEPGAYKFVGYPFTKTPWTSKKLQVIVKLASIHLTPDKPAYPGGSWHIEGQLNERIVATALYYIDNANVTDSHLSFRTACNAEALCENFGYAQSDHAPFAAIFGANPGLDEHSTVLELGQVHTRAGRLLVFPNVMQHRVGPFELADRTRAGHRKIVALFLVDPETPVISTAHVPPQQMHWGSSGVQDRLPPEVAEMVYAHVECPYRLDEAKRIREKLIDERRAIDKDANKAVNHGDFSFCEH